MIFCFFTYYLPLVRLELYSLLICILDIYFVAKWAQFTVRLYLLHFAIMIVTSVASYFEYEKLNQFLSAPTVLSSSSKHRRQRMRLSTYRKWHSRLSIFWVGFNERLVSLQPPILLTVDLNHLANISIVIG